MGFRIYLVLFLFIINLVSGGIDFHLSQPQIYVNDGNLYLVPAVGRDLILVSNNTGKIYFNNVELNYLEKSILNASRDMNAFKRIFGNPSNESQLSMSSRLRSIEQSIERLENIEDFEARLINVERLAQNFSRGSGGGNSKKQTRKFRLLRRKITALENKITNLATEFPNPCSSNPCLNSGTCVPTLFGPFCMCAYGWEGDRCQMDVNECLWYVGSDLGCQNGATCINEPGSYRCQCANGWMGVHCTKRQGDCSSGAPWELCGHGICVDQKVGSRAYTCICDQGWKTDGNSPACQVDVDECSESHASCSKNPPVMCVNVPGSFHCGPCPQGYTGNGFHCSDIDECQVNNGGCSQNPRVACINTMGSRICGECPPGYIGNGISCQYQGLCQINNGGCHPLARCSENAMIGQSFVQCSCPAGYTGTGMGNHGCFPYGGGGGGGGVINSCASNPCGANGVCNQIGNAFHCICNQGWAGATCNDRLDPCQSNPCQNGGTCSSSFSSRSSSPNLYGFVCHCTNDFTGDQCQIQEQSCGGHLEAEEGTLKFPHSSGSSTRNHENCAWVIQTTRGKVLNITFTSFHLLGNQFDCDMDWLEIHDGGDTQSPLLGRFCGSTLPKGGNFTSTHEVLYLWFWSDHAMNGLGFELNWNSTDPECGGYIFGETHGVISSPGYPGHYPNNRDCVWSINVNYNRRIQMAFANMRIENHPNCSFDYVEVRDGDIENSPLLAKYCNTTLPAPIISSTSHVSIRFHSDYYGSDTGFHMTFIEAPGIPGCGGTFTAEKGVISSPHHPETYAHLMDCEYLIRLPYDDRVSLVFTTFELETANNCFYDSVEIRDGNSIRAPLIGRFCGRNTPPPFISSGNSLLVHFRTDETISMGGFQARYEAACGGTFSELSGLIKSPYHPSNYPGNRQCVYIISLPVGRGIKLEFQDFEIESGVGENPRCLFDYLEIRDGDTENSTLIGHYCGTAKPDPIISTHNYLWLKFKSDGSVHNKGFLANYSSVDVGCGGIFKQKHGIIRINENPIAYPHGVSCTWIISGDPGEIVRLSWVTFSLEGGSECRYDRVEVFDNSTQFPNGTLMGRFCGNELPSTMTSSDNRITITFHSDDSVAHEGFMANYVILNASHVCGGNYFTETGQITTPGYPSNYGGGKSCVWTIKVGAGHQIQLNVSDFEVENGTTQECAYDYLEIRNGLYENSPLIGKFCDNFPPPRLIPSHANSLYLKFVSDTSREYRGFKIYWDGTTTGCGGDLFGSGSLISPNYPMSFGARTECLWTIRVNHGSAIQFVFVDLDLQRVGGDCRSDFIEIQDGPQRNSPILGPFCHSDAPLSLNSTGNTLQIKFVSRYGGSGRGFQARFQTLCNRVIKGHRGQIESPNFPNPYPHNRNCTWEIQAPVGNKINASFSHFSIEGPSRNACRYDYLQISENSRLHPSNITNLGKYCGEDYPPLITSNFDRLLIHFESDSSFAMNGFRMEWVINGCGGRYVGPWNYISTPDYPKHYSVMTECEWYITTEIGTKVQLTITDLDIELAVNCQFDHLRVYGGTDEHSPLLTELCHSITESTTVTSHGNNMFIKFYSDGTVTGKGFSAYSRQMPGGCGGYFSTPEGTIYSPNYPKSYDHDDECAWIITVDRNHIVELTFLDFDVETHTNCTFDHVAIYDGSSMDNPLLLMHCGNLLPDPPLIRSTGNKLYIHFKTDGSLSAKGFKLGYKTGCGARLVDRTFGEIKSPGFPKFSRGLNCSWIIMGSNTDDHVMLTFTHLDLQTTGTEVVVPDCGNDFVQVLDGVDDEAPEIGKYCLNKIPPAIVSQGQGLVLRIQIKNGFGGFRATFEMSTSACGSTLTSAQGSFTSPSYPNGYPPNIECTWTISASAGNRVQMSFLQMDIEASEFCNTDFVEIHESSLDGPLLGHFCGNTIPANVTAAERLVVLFRTDGEGQAPGFWADYSLIHGNELTGPFGYIESPLYPHPNFIYGEFTWRITVNQSKGISIQFYVFDFDDDSYHPSTCRNYIKIHDGFDSNAPELFYQCMGFPTDPITSTGNVLYISYVKVFVNIVSLFRLSWTEIDIDPNAAQFAPSNIIGCGGNFTLNEGNSTSLYSPGYINGSGYNANLNCTWNLRTLGHSRIKIKIEDLELEHHSQCSYDRVELYDGYLGTSNYQLNKTICLRSEVGNYYQSSGSLAQIAFITDASFNLRGFNFTLEPICGGILRGTNGRIQSPNYPSHYGHSRCEWTIIVRPGRTIQLTFDDFEIYTAQGDCSTDRLIIRNGGNKESPFLGQGRYCGNTIPSIPESGGNQLFLALTTFTSSGKGFSLTFSEVSVACGGQIHLTHEVKEFQFNSPNFPQMPPPFTECEWVFTAPQNEVVQIDFLQLFQIFRSFGCTRAGVEIKDGGTLLSPIMATYCRDMPGTIKSSGNIIYVRYFTNVNEPRNGFKAKASIGSCGGTIITDYYGQLTSPEFPNTYKPNLLCDWIIKGPIGSYLTLRFQIFELGDVPGNVESTSVNSTSLEIPTNSEMICPEDKDYLFISEANFTEEMNMRNWTFCGPSIALLPSRITTSTNQILIRLKTDSIAESNRKGFKISYSTSRERCGGTLRSSSGIVQTPNYPSPYDHTRYCYWRIIPPEGRRVRLEFLDFDLEPKIITPHDSFCADLVTIRQVYADHYNIPHTFYNESLCGGDLPPPVESTSDQTLVVAFFTDGSVAHRGFKARYSTDLPSLCGGDLTGDTGSVSSVGMEPTGTPNTTTSVICKWMHQGPEDNGTTIITLTDVNIPPWKPDEKTHCQNADGFVVVTGISRQLYTSTSYGNYYCGKQTNQRIYIPGQGFQIRYMAKHWESSFNLSWRIAPCGGVIPGESNLTSPNFGNSSYPENIECIWILRPERYLYNSHIRITFTDLDLDGHQVSVNSETGEGGCDRDYVIIRNGMHSSSPIMGKYCGSSPPPSFLSMSPELWIEFHSDGNDDGNKRGFRIQTEYVTYGCGGTIHSKKGFIKSPTSNIGINPNRYPANTECEWTIEGVEGYSLHLLFTDRFDIEKNTNCTNDYVEIFSKNKNDWNSIGRFCGKEVPPLINTTSYIIKVLFRSNPTIDGDGFKLNWYSKCGGIYEDSSGIIRSAHYDGDFVNSNNIWSWIGYERVWTVNKCKYVIKGNSSEDFIVTEFLPPFDVSVPINYGIPPSTITDQICPFVNVSMTELPRLPTGNPVIGWRPRERSTGVFCGKELPVAFIGRGGIAINYNYRPQFSNYGFRIKYNIFKCGGNLTEGGIISSPGHPFTSAPNMNCTWIIRAPIGRVVRIKFEKLELEYSSSCSYDFVKLFEGPSINDSAKLGTFCGNMTEEIRRVSSIGNVLTLQFYTDWSVQHSGFKAVADFSLGSSQGCGGRLNATSPVNLRSPDANNDGKYDAYLDCQWFVIGADYQILEVNFNSFNLEGGRRGGGAILAHLNETDPCPYDYVKIYDGTGPSDPLIGVFCGSSIPPRISSSRNMLWINFVSDGVNAFSGFRASIASRPSPCGPSLVLNATTSPQILTSPEFPSSYPHNLRCKWTIFGARLHDEVDIRFIDLNIETSADCVKDRLQISDISASYTSAEGMSGPILFTGRNRAQERDWRFRNLDFFTDSLMQNLIYCGTQIPSDFFSISRSVELSFNSDAFNSGRGFKIEYKSAGCNRTFENYQGRVFSPEWPTHSPIFSNCIFTIKTPNNTFASVYFNEFFLIDSESCSESALEIREGSQGGRQLARYCGSTRPNPVFANSNILWVNYFTRFRINRGFDFSFSSATTSAGCGGDFFHTGGSFTSPEYPGSVSTNVDCRWRIRVPGGLRVQIDFQTFQLGSDCNSDFLEIFSMNSHETSSNPTLFSRYCAGDTPAQYNGNTDMAMIRYKASANHSSIGWLLDFKGVLSSS